MDAFLSSSAHKMSKAIKGLSTITKHRLNQNLIHKGVEGPVAWKRKDGKVIPYPGITAKIKKKLYPKYKSGIGTSDRHTGTRVHRQIYHSIECKDECKCDVKTRKYNKMVKQAYSLMKHHHLEPIASEVPLISHTMHVATRLDLVCRYVYWY